MDIVDRNADQPLCPLCGVAMPLVHTRLREGADLHRFECTPCGVTFTEVAQAQRPRVCPAPRSDVLSQLI
jgi:transposase-like protein